MSIRITALAFVLLTGCATTEPATGSRPPVIIGQPIPTPDPEIVQCQNQPELPWCQN